MWNTLNSRFVVAAMIMLGLPLMLYIVLMASSQTIARSITASMVESAASIATGENKKVLQDVVSGFTKQLITGLQEPFSAMQKEQEAQTRAEIDTLSNIKVSAIKLVPSDFGGKKVIGTITNGSGRDIQQLHLSISAYDAAGTLVNVSSEWLSDVKVIKAQQAMNFAISPGMLRPVKDQVFIEPARLEVTVSQFAILEAPKQVASATP